jgi:tRNA(Met) cytidine acetyltransferase
MNSKHRSILALSGEQSACLKRSQSFLNGQNSIYISHKKHNNTPNIPHNKVRTQLGQENSFVVFDATEHFDANALGVISGTIIGGGMLILLLPPVEYSYPNPVFLSRLYTVLEQHNIPVFQADAPNIMSLLPDLPQQANEKTEHSDKLETFTLSTEQHDAVDAVIKVAKGRSKRPLVLTADRGRGKSTALGVAAKTLLESGLTRIIICAPAKAMIQPLLQQTKQQEGIHYFAPDQLDREHPEAELVIIDEAGAIPVPLLSRLLKHYSRMVFSTTLQGYEGNGKGFAIRFQSQLDALTPNWCSLQLQAPIRWGANDPLEALINDVLLLNAEPALSESLEKPSLDNLEYQQLKPQKLAVDEELLRQLFGLLIIAHYQTRPSDLLQLLDSPELSIHVLIHNNNILAAAIVSHEGGFNSDLSQQIFEGKRRPKGNLVPQILTFQLGIPHAATLKTDRIMRIAVHPTYQQNRLGSHLLGLIRQYSSADYLSSSFGMHVDLLHFWGKSDYHTAYLGLKREASSGYHSAVMLCPLTPKGDSLLKESQAAFKRHFCAQLADILKYYEPGMALDLLSSNLPNTDVELSVQEQRDIMRFANGFCGCDLVMSALLRWLPNALADYNSRICREDGVLLVMRVLQHHDWSHCCQLLNLQGKQQAQVSMQQAVAKLLNPVSITNYPGKD